MTTAFYLRIFVAQTHPGFIAANWTNDVALIKLNKPVKDIEPMKLARDPTRTFESERCTVIGWGRTTAILNTTSVLLREYTNWVIPGLSCSLLVAVFDMYHEICLNGPGSSCRGDSGGPLLCDGLVAGVASHSHIDCLIRPSSYARVSSHYRWIMKTIEEHTPTVTTPEPKSTKPTTRFLNPRLRWWQKNGKVTTKKTDLTTSANPQVTKEQTTKEPNQPEMNEPTTEKELTTTEPNTTETNELTTTGSNPTEMNEPTSTEPNRTEMNEPTTESNPRLRWAQIWKVTAMKTVTTTSATQTEASTTEMNPWKVTTTTSEPTETTRDAIIEITSPTLDDETTDAKWEPKGEVTKETDETTTTETELETTSDLPVEKTTKDAWDSTENTKKEDLQRETNALPNDPTSEPAELTSTPFDTSTPINESTTTSIHSTAIFDQTASSNNTTAASPESTVVFESSTTSLEQVNTSTVPSDQGQPSTASIASTSTSLDSRTRNTTTTSPQEIDALDQ